MADLFLKGSSHPESWASRTLKILKKELKNKGEKKKKKNVKEKKKKQLVNKQLMKKKIIILMVKVNKITIKQEVMHNIKDMDINKINFNHNHNNHNSLIINNLNSLNNQWRIHQ